MWIILIKSVPNFASQLGWQNRGYFELHKTDSWRRLLILLISASSWSSQTFRKVQRSLQSLKKSNWTYFRLKVKHPGKQDFLFLRSEKGFFEVTENKKQCESSKTLFVDIRQSTICWFCLWKKQKTSGMWTAVTVCWNKLERSFPWGLGLWAPSHTLSHS